jgi:flagellar assembly protein FliH
MEQASRAAFEQGRAAGRQEARAELEGLMRQLAQSIEAMAGMKPRLRQEAERDVVSLSLSIARRILRREMQVDRDAVLGLVKAAFENTSMREVTLVRTHASHAELIRKHLAGLGAPECIEVKIDSGLEPGAVVVETSRGSLDSSLDTQLEEIGNGLADILNGSGSGSR